MRGGIVGGAPYHLFYEHKVVEGGMTAASDGGRTDQRFADALCGPDGTSDPTVLMPVLQVHPDALSAPMPDAMVTAIPIDVAAALAAVRQATPPPAPPARPGSTGRIAQPGRSGRNQASTRPADRPSRPAPSARGTLESRSAAAPQLQWPRQADPRHSPTPTSTGAWSGRVLSPGEVAGFLRNTFAGVARDTNPVPRQQPATHAPAPPLPRNAPRRNKGSGVWAVFVFLVVIAFASGLGQQIIRAISEMFNP